MKGGDSSVVDMKKNEVDAKEMKGGDSSVVDMKDNEMDAKEMKFEESSVVDVKENEFEETGEILNEIENEPGNVQSSLQDYTELKIDYDSTTDDDYDMSVEIIANWNPADVKVELDKEQDAKNCEEVEVTLANRKCSESNTEMDDNRSDDNSNFNELKYEVSSNVNEIKDTVIHSDGNLMVDDKEVSNNRHNSNNEIHVVNKTIDENLYPKSKQSFSDSEKETVNEDTVGRLKRQCKHDKIKTEIGNQSEMLDESDEDVPGAVDNSSSDYDSADGERELTKIQEANEFSNESKCQVQFVDTGDGNIRELHICRICNKAFPLAYALTVHIGRIHSGRTEVKVPPAASLQVQGTSKKKRNRVKKHECPICSKLFRETYALNVHLTIHSKDKNFKCEICFKAFGHQSFLTKHYLVHTQEKKYKCEFCDKCFQKGVSLKSHMRTHTGEKPYVCEVCQKSFRMSGHLYRHMHVHTDTKPFTCRICSKGFVDQYSFDRHSNTHLADKPFKCSLCEKAYSQASGLELHMRTHTGEKSYECDVCKRMFRERSHLKRHSYTHIEEKDLPEHCEVCGKGCGAKDLLRKHMRTHSTPSEYTCDICDKKFKYINHLNLHRYIHEGAKPYQCTLCDKGYSRSSHLKAHYTKTHKVKNPEMKIVQKYDQNKLNSGLADNVDTDENMDEDNVAEHKDNVVGNRKDNDDQVFVEEVMNEITSGPEDELTEASNA